MDENIDNYGLGNYAAKTVRFFKIDLGAKC